MPRPEVSIIIPAFNEAERLPTTLEQLLGYLEGTEFTSEVIVVDDGSSDDTAQKVAPPATVIRNDSNHGKGYAVRQGILAASGAVRVFMDADLSVPPEYLLELVNRIREGNDVVIGSRGVPGSEVVAGGRQYRRTMGRVFNHFVQLLAVRGIHDTQCGFKGFTEEAAQLLFPLQKLDGFAFDVELLYLARRKGLRIFEMPVRWVDQEASKVRPGIDSLKMLKDLIRIRWLHRRD